MELNWIIFEVLGYTNITVVDRVATVLSEIIRDEENRYCFG